MLRTYMVLLQSVVLGVTAFPDSGPEHVVLADDASQARVLEAAHRQWLSDTTFVCGFKTYIGVVTSRQEAQSVSPSDLTLEAEGVFVKQGETVRLRYVPADEPTVETKDGREAWSGLPFDEVSNGDIQIRFEVPSRAHGATTLRVEGKAGTRTLPYQAGTLTRSVITPLYIAGRRFLDPYSFGASDGRDADRQFRILESDPQERMVEVTMKTGPWTRKKTVTYWMGGSAPVIQQVTTRDDHEQSGNWIETQTIGRNFVECPGGPIAKEVRYWLGQKERDGSWKVRMWISEDLGLRKPNVEDFVINVPKGSRIRGLKQDLTEGTVRDVNIFDIGLEDLRTGERPNDSDIDVSTESSLRQARTWIFVNLIVIALVAIVFIARRALGRRKTL